MPAQLSVTAGVSPERVGNDASFSFPVLVLSGFVVGLVVPAWIVLTSGGENPDWPWAMAITIVTAARYSWVIAAGQQRLVEMTFWLFSYVFFGLAPLAQLRRGISPGTTPRTFTEHTVTAASIVLVGLVSFTVASWACTWYRSARLGDRRDDDGGLRGVPTARRTVLVAAGGLVMAAYYLYSIRSALFTNLAVVGDAAAAAFPNTTVAAVLSALSVMPLLVALLALMARRRRGPVNSWETVLLVVVCGFLLVAVNPFSSPRYVVGTVYLAVVAALGMFATPRRFRVVAITAVAAFVFVFPLADAFRNVDTGGLSTVGPSTSLLNGDFDAFAQIDNTVLYVDELGVTGGRQALGVALFWVPRGLWVDKPVDTGVLLADFRDYGFTNLSAPLWSELFINVGWPAVVVGGAALGWWARGRDDRVLRRLSRTRAPDVLGCIIPFYLIFLLRGSLLQAMTNVVVIVVAAWWVERRSDPVTPT